MDLLRHLPSPIAPSFSEALRIDTQAGCWIFVSGQVGVPLPPDKGSVTFEQEARTTFERIRDSLSKLGAGMDHVVSIKNNCPRNIKVKVCYYQSQSCREFEIQGYKRVDTILGTMTKISRFRYTITQK